MDVRKVIENITKKYSEIKWGFTKKNFVPDSEKGYYVQGKQNEFETKYKSQVKDGIVYLLLNGFSDAAIEKNSKLANYIVVTQFIDMPKATNIKITKKGKNKEDNNKKFEENIDQGISYFSLKLDFFTSHIFKVIDDDGNESLDEVQKFLKGIEQTSNKPMGSDEEEKMNSKKENSEYKLFSVNTILYGPPGTGKTYNSIKYAVDTIDKKFSQDGAKTYTDYADKFNELKTVGQIAFTTFHQSYGYEEFIEGIKPFLGKRGVRRGRSDLNYKISDGVFKEFCNKAASDESNNYVFIIDEINRGNISKIFGELITLIEDSKRNGKDEAMSVTLPYSQEEFSVPKNVYILGTMNTADRSIALMDTALRRRFEFIEMMPDESLLDNVVVEDISIQKMLEKMNQRIEVLYDREHTLGHAFFMPLKNKKKATLDQLASIFSNKIIPLLQEYFYEDYEKIMLVLGIDPQNIETNKFISVKSNSNLFKNSPDIDLNPTYQINEKAFQTPDNYMTIYGGASNAGEADETKDSDS
ncbi:McrB family protein [Streptococcus sinensis]|uniref:Putative endonuclease n=1 Tax=Streptococcus sinensis TaxID=176090 RepID=A0A0A0DIK6_9STRE|nr:AAA family ATPase [Streptococcus sinensis]KGM37718.1 putative endonuclease [Streptococcus sinensis]